MQSPVEKVDFLKTLKESPSLSANEINGLVKAAAGSNAVDFRQAVTQLQREAESSNDDRLKTHAGIGLFYLGQPRSAAELLSGVKQSGAAQFYLGQAYSTLGQHEAAAAAFESAAKLGFEPILATLRRAGELRRLGHLDEAEKMVRSTGSEGVRLAEYCYQMGGILMDRGDSYGAIEYFERAVDMDPHHSPALFAMAVQNSLHGNDEEAIRLYERCLSKPPYYLGAMLNLGLLYEDQENYGAAQYCFERVLHFDPTNERARLYLKDIEATGDMYYDEETLRNQARLEQLLSRPVTDFELSVRSRNCLQSMNIETLGDLTETSEQELLSGKNFGETSLIEIRELMSQHGLSIGQNLHQKSHREPTYSVQDLSPQEQALLSKPVADLNLSVRARKCMTRLGITTLGELVSRTPDELLSAKNFGVTSLNEVRQKLNEYDLKLRND